MLMTPSVLNPLVYFLFYFIFCFGPLVKFMQNPRRAQVVQNQSVTGREGDFVEKQLHLRCAVCEGMHDVHDDIT
jgi:hypothetical protein